MNSIVGMSALTEDKNWNLLLAQLEAILFVSSEPLDTARLRLFFNLEPAEWQELLIRFKACLNSNDRGLYLMEFEDKLQLTTKRELHQKLETFFSRKHKIRFSLAALETLAIIAYRQPITLAEIAQMRGGINSSGALRNLMQKKLVKIGGRKKIAGSPALYVTTPDFLNYFNLSSLEDLPSVEELAEIIADKEQVSFYKREED